MTSLPDHPGFLGFTSEGVIAIHADWPAYPVEHGWEIALEYLGQFPRRSVLYQLDDIDQCFLLVFGEPKSSKDPFAAKNLHIAIWRDDMRALADRGLVTGVYDIPLEEWVSERRRELSGMFWKAPDGQYHQVPLPTLDDFGEDEESPVLMLSSTGISVTDLGWATLGSLLAAKRDSLHSSIKLRALPIVSTGQLDSAVREASLLVEVRMRAILRSEKYGQKMIDELYGVMASSRTFTSASVKTFIIDARTAFRFVRNEYMHTLQELTFEQCLALLARMSRLLATLDEIDRVLNAPNRAETAV